MSKTLTINEGDPFRCPHCNEGDTWDEKPVPVEDYTIFGRVGEASKARDECWDCDGEFVVTNNGDGTFTVEAIE